MLSCVWPLSLSTVSEVYLHCSMLYCLGPCHCQTVFHCLDTLHLFIKFPADGTWSQLPLLDIIYNSMMDLCFQVSQCDISVSTQELPHHMEILFIVLRNCQTLAKLL